MKIALPNLVRELSTILFFGLLVALLASGCTPALPEGQVEKVSPATMTEIANAAQKAERASAEAKKESARAEKMLEEARGLYKQAQDSHHACEALVRTIPKKPRIKIVYKAPEQTEAVSASTTQPRAAGTPVAQTPQQPANHDPEHSASDAP